MGRAEPFDRVGEFNGSKHPGTSAAVQSLTETVVLKQMVGQAPAFEKVKQHAVRAAKADATVLILGETGTGKELAAQAIHYLSERSRGPFVPVNCGAIPAHLFENELFGHCPGAFTDARARANGLLAEAEGGTLFLDELDSLPLETQVKLLRLLENQTYRPLGSPREIRADVRIVSATNGDLHRKMADGTFRRDLYYRISLIQLTLPPLREREADILLLAEHFLCRYGGQNPGWSFSPEAKRAMEAHSWPGNVRELDHIIRRAVIMNQAKSITPEDLSLSEIQGPPRAEAEHEPSEEQPFRAAREQFERRYIENLLRLYRGNISRAARVAQQDRTSFRRLIRKYRVMVRPAQVSNSYGSPGGSSLEKAALDWNLGAEKTLVS